MGMTRAREKLILTSAQYRVLYGHGDFTRESMFIGEIDPKLLDVIGNTYRPTRKTDDRLKTGLSSLDGFARAPRSPFGGSDVFEDGGSRASYDPLKFARQQIRETVSSDTFQPGDQVSHGKFGHGIVVDATATTVTVVFDEFGTKKLALGMAPLKKV